MRLNAYCGSVLWQSSLARQAPVRRPGWIHFSCNGKPVFPAKGLGEDYRLNIGSIVPENYARIVDIDSVVSLKRVSNQ